MLEYDPIKRKFPGDAEMRRCTSQKRKDRATNNKDSGSLHDTRQSNKKTKRGRPTPAMMRLSKFRTEFLRAKDARGENSRLCGNLTRLNKHLKSVETSLKHPKSCKVCGGDAYSECEICGVFLHTMPAKGKNAGKTCFFDYHDDCFFGLARDDGRVREVKKSEWAYPTQAKRKRNEKRYLRRLKMKRMLYQDGFNINKVAFCLIIILLLSNQNRL